MDAPSPFMAMPDEEDAWDRMQWPIHDLLVSERDPLLREALYRQGEKCIQGCGGSAQPHCATRLRHFQVAYLLTSERGAVALS